MTRREELDSIARQKQMLAKQDDIMSEIRNVKREIAILRSGHEASTWGEKVEDMEDADLEEMEPEEEVTA